MRKSTKYLIGILLVLAFFLTSIPLDTAQPWLVGWRYRKSITIQHANVDGNLTDFPVYIDITADGEIGKKISDATDGFDIRFTQSNGTTLIKYEREEFSVAASVATGYYWVKVPSILAASGAVIYLYYNDADGTVDGEDAANVWDANFLTVYQMADKTIATLGDSKGLIDATKKGNNEPIEATGKVYKAQEHDGNDYSHMDSNPAIDSSDLTISAWTYPDDNNPRTIIQRGRIQDVSDYFGWALRTDIDDLAFGRMEGDANFHRLVSTGGITSGTWNFVAVTYKKSDGAVKMRINGAQVATDTFGTGNIAYNATFDNGTSIGTHDYKIAMQFYMLGEIDNLRVSNSVRSVDWLKFVYHNINEADNELTWGEEAVQYVPKVVVINED